MKKRNQKGFTIVELVIVIAVIAILAAVLIPTFADLIDKAHKSNDDVLVRNLNTLLTTDEYLNGTGRERITVNNAIAVAAENGYDVEKLTPTSEGNLIVWDESVNRFVLVDDQFEPLAEDGKLTNVKENIWLISDKYNTVKGVEKEEYKYYSQYLKATPDAALSVNAGVAFADGINGVDVSYAPAADAERKDDFFVSFVMNGGTLTVNDEKADVHSYGLKNEVVVTAVAPKSYHEWGRVLNKITAHKGHISIEATAEVSVVIVPTADAENVTVDIAVAGKTSVFAPSSFIYYINGKGYTPVADESVYNTYEAKVGTEYYTELSRAIALAPEGDTVLVLKDVELNDTNTVNIFGSGNGSYGVTPQNDVIVDLGGHVVTSKNTRDMMYNYYDVDVTFKNGTIIANQKIYMAAGSLTIAPDATIMMSSNNPAIVLEPANGNVPTIKLNVYGTVIAKANYAIANSGNRTAPQTTAINVYSGAVIKSEEAAIYHPGNGDVTIENGAYIEGLSAIEMRAGNITINGGTIVATGGFKVVPNGNGSTTEGVALAISQHSTEVPISVVINGGTFIGEKALYETDTIESESPSEGVVIIISDGTFNGDVTSVNDKITYSEK